MGSNEFESTTSRIKVLAITDMVLVAEQHPLHHRKAWRDISVIPILLIDGYLTGPLRDVLLLDGHDVLGSKGT